MSVPSPQLLADLRKHATAINDAYSIVSQEFIGQVVPPVFMQINPRMMLALVDRIEALEAIAKPLLDAELEPNEPFWPEGEDDSHEGEWCPVPGAARRALWRLRQK